jgi:hypothetical protein
MLGTAVVASFVAWMSAPQDVSGYVSVYVDSQLLRSVRGELERSPHRLLILETLGKQLAPAVIIIVVLSAVTGLRKGMAAIRRSGHSVTAWALTITGLCASLPFLAFLKQMSWYVVPSLPWLAMAFAMFTRSLAVRLQTLLVVRATLRLHMFAAILLVGLVSLIGGVAGFGHSTTAIEIRLRDRWLKVCGMPLPDFRNSEYAWSNFNRDIVKQISSLPPRSIVGFNPSLLHDSWRIIAYSQRVYRVSLVPRRPGMGIFIQNAGDPIDTMSHLMQASSPSVYALYDSSEQTSKGTDQEGTGNEHSKR